MTTLSAPEVVLPAGEAERPPSRRARRWADILPPAGAAMLHLAILGALLLHVAAPLDLAEPPALETEVISARAFEALRPSGPAVPPPEATATSAAPEAGLPATSPATPATPSAAAPAAAPAAPAAPSAPPAAAPPDDTVRPVRMLSAQALASPKSRALRRELATLADEERIAQLCDLEAMEQIHAWRAGFQPDRLVDYARAEPRMSGARFVAAGGAFRSRRGWYEVSFQCELDAAGQAVVGFAFRVGASIPPDQWAGYNLAAVH
ncbi:DUF930 domain-containing protein [Ancylobacter lacus]|nr:DUF930 domain-containing protein [Ancylobacter lacus]